MRIKFIRSVLTENGKPSKAGEIADYTDAEARIYLSINAAVSVVANESIKDESKDVLNAVSNGLNRDIEAVQTKAKVFKNRGKR